MNEDVDEEDEEEDENEDDSEHAEDERNGEEHDTREALVVTCSAMCEEAATPGCMQCAQRSPASERGTPDQVCGQAVS